MPYIVAYFHVVWTTKLRRQHLDSPAKRKEVWKFIRKYGFDNGIHVDIAGGYHDHCHCLISLNSSQSLSEVVGRLKGASSRFVNATSICPNDFSWQRGYWASSIGPERLNVVRNYIKNQEQHHGGSDFQDEFDIMKKENGGDAWKGM
jgi:REP element-mobilizing transposase RayT